MRQKLRPRTRLPNIRLKCHLRLRAASDAPERGPWAGMRGPKTGLLQPDTEIQGVRRKSASLAA